MREELVSDTREEHGRRIKILQKSIKNIHALIFVYLFLSRLTSRSEISDVPRGIP